jgi:hypothetical protein
MKRGPHPDRPRPHPRDIGRVRVVRCESWLDEATGDLCSIVDLENGTGYSERVPAAELRERHGVAERTH